MNEAVKRFIEEMGATYAADGDRDVSPILLKTDDENGGTLFELSLPKGEGHPFWRVRERLMTADEVVALMERKKFHAQLFEGEPWGVGSMMPDTHLRIRGYVYNARRRGEWNLSVDDLSKEKVA